MLMATHKATWDVCHRSKLEEEEDLALYNQSDIAS